jgi:hypothetical protein
MLRRLSVCLLMTAAVVLAQASAAHAQQTLNFSLGYFTLLGPDARVDDDVLNVNRTFLVFDIDEFNGASIGGEWLVPLGEYLEGGAGVSFSRRTVPSVYEDFIDADGTEIDQDLRLRLIPIAFTFRLLPLGQQSAVQPYIGAGLGLINWRYSEFGEFADFGAGNPPPIFEDSFVASGTKAGPLVLGGIRFGGDTVTAGGEVRYQKADADLDNRFAGRKLDLGGWTYNFTIGVRFGR